MKVYFGTPQKQNQDFVKGRHTQKKKKHTISPLITIPNLLLLDYN